MRIFHSILILIAITFFAYGFSLTNTFVWDDEQFIYNNVYVKNFDITKILTQNTIAGAGENSTYYRPLTTLSFAIDHQIWGLRPFGFHLTNTLLHLSAGLILFFYLKTLKFSNYSSLIIASIFLIHPLQTEAVVYANSRGDSMYAFWSLLSLLFFALLLNKKYPQIIIYDLKMTLNKNILLVGTIFSFIFSILSKEIGIASFGLLGLTYLFSQIQNNNNFSFKNLLNNWLAILVLVGTSFSAFAYLIFRNYILNIPTTLNDHFAGTPYGESLYVRLHTFTSALWKYFQLIFFPYPLHMERHLMYLTELISFWLILTFVLFIAIFILSIAEYKKNKTTYIPFGSLWFLGMLVPVSGIIPVNGLIYEHWLYMPIIGFSIFLYGLKHLLISKKRHMKINQILKNIIPIVILIFIFLTIRQNYIWNNPIRFYSYTLQFAKTARLHNNLAMAYAEKSEFEQAIDQYQEAIEFADFYPHTHYNLGNTYLAMNQTELAIQEFERAIEMQEGFLPAYFPLIKILHNEKKYDQVTEIVNKLLQIPGLSLEYQKMFSDLIKSYK
jgi:protein O-mannosyl-transferase